MPSRRAAKRKSDYVIIIRPTARQPLDAKLLGSSGVQHQLLQLASLTNANKPTTTFASIISHSASCRPSITLYIEHRSSKNSKHQTPQWTTARKLGVVYVDSHSNLQTVLCSPATADSANLVSGTAQRRRLRRLRRLLPPAQRSQAGHAGTHSDWHLSNSPEVQGRRRHGRRQPGYVTPRPNTPCPPLSFRDHSTNTTCAQPRTAP